MKKRSLKIKISRAIGSVSAESMIPKESKAVIIIAHGAGAGMNHEFMAAIARSLADKDIASLRFNFPFMENKKGRPDTPAVAHQTIEAVINKTKKLFPALPLFVSGKSFGGRMTSQYLSINHATKVSGIIFYGFPLHAPGKPSIERADHLKEVKVPMLFLSGSRDEFATWKLLSKVCSALTLAELIKIEGANHSFKAGKRDVISELAVLSSDWIDKTLKKKK